MAMAYDELVCQRWPGRTLSGDAHLGIARREGRVHEAAFRQADADVDAWVEQPKALPQKSWWNAAGKGTRRQQGLGKWGSKCHERQQGDEDEAQRRERARQ